MSQGGAKDGAEFLPVLTLPLHTCGCRLESDGWCARCDTTPDSSEYVKVAYMRASPTEVLPLGAAAEMLRMSQEKLEGLLDAGVI